MNEQRDRARHDLGNAITVARASVEAMLDGVVPIDRERLLRVSEVLRSAGELLEQLKR